MPRGLHARSLPRISSFLGVTLVLFNNSFPDTTDDVNLHALCFISGKKSFGGKVRFPSLDQ